MLMLMFVGFIVEVGFGFEIDIGIGIGVGVCKGIVPGLVDMNVLCI